MNNYYSTVIYPFVERLIRDNQKPNSLYELKVDSLDEIDQQTFAMHLVEYDGRDLHSIYENERYDDIVSCLFSMLKKDDMDTKLDFAEMVRDKIISHYKEKMQEMIDEIIGWVEQEDKTTEGCTRRQHKDNGETYWASL